MQRRGCAPRIVMPAVWVLSAVGLAGDALAAHVTPMSLSVLADHAGQVIDGEVIGVRSYWADAPRRIESEIVFARVRYLKGALGEADDTFVLRVPGGTVGEMQMRLCCAPQFAVGERWLLFLLPSSPTYPIVGLYQGALRVVSDPAGEVRIHTADDRAVIGLDADGMVRSAGEAPSHGSPVVREAHHLRIEPPHKPPAAPAMRFADFLATLQPILDASRDHGLRSPAGVFAPIAYTPTRLESAAPQPVVAAQEAAATPGRGADAVRSAPADERSGRAE